MSPEDDWYIPAPRPPAPKVELPPPPPPPRRVLRYELWHLLTCSAAALVLGFSAGTVARVNHDLNPPTTTIPTR